MQKGEREGIAVFVYFVSIYGIHMQHYRANVIINGIRI